MIQTWPKCSREIARLLRQPSPKRAASRKRKEADVDSATIKRPIYLLLEGGGAEDDALGGQSLSEQDRQVLRERTEMPPVMDAWADVLREAGVDALREHRRQQLEMRFALGLGKLSDDALLFPELDGSPQSPRAFSNDWADVADSIGLGDITFHALRHTHASHLIDAGIDVVKISLRLGHASPAITLKVYAHLFPKRDDKSSTAINAAVESLFNA